VQSDADHKDETSKTNSEFLRIIEEALAKGNK
jgi:hypothetical protein